MLAGGCTGERNTYSRPEQVGLAVISAAEDPPACLPPGAGQKANRLCLRYREIAGRGQTQFEYSTDLVNWLPYRGDLVAAQKDAYAASGEKVPIWEVGLPAAREGRTVFYRYAQPGADL